jgi:Hydrazine synthase alpha subunit middle domain
MAGVLVLVGVACGASAQDADSQGSPSGSSSGAVSSGTLGGSSGVDAGGASGGIGSSGASNSSSGMGSSSGSSGCSKAPAVATPATNSVDNPILFVTLPKQRDTFGGRTGVFANHVGREDLTPRGGALMIRYRDGSTRNLTLEAGFENIAARDPSVHWDGKKAIFSMVGPSDTWQMYEVTGMLQGEAVSIKKVLNQPNYNNITPFYAADDAVLFTSDTPRDPRNSHLYPMADEYESAPSITGIWTIEKGSTTAHILNNTPSGAFNPFIDSFGRVLFTRWDHLKQDQQAETGEAYNLASEAPGAQRQSRREVFPEPFLSDSTSPYGPVRKHDYNLFTPWQMNQDGTAELSINHLGRHEFGRALGPASFGNDPALQDYSPSPYSANKTGLRLDGGLFQVREDPREPGVYYTTYAREFASMTSGQIIRFNGAIGVDAEKMSFVALTPGDGESSFPAGRFRDPVPLTTGAMIASHSVSTEVNESLGFRLKIMTRGADGKLSVGANLTSLSGKMWEWEPVEVVARQRANCGIDDALDPAAKAVFSEEKVDQSEFRQWLKNKKLALIVTNNQTSRDRADVQQPFNLEVPGGVKSARGIGRVYPIAYYQLIESQQIRGYAAYNDASPAKRLIGMPMGLGLNKPNPGGPEGSVKIFSDGSSAAFVPSNRAMAWQTTDPAGVPIVRERVWVTFQPGETRTCSGCHGANSKDQMDRPSPSNKPEALRDLLRHWKNLPK